MNNNLYQPTTAYKAGKSEIKAIGGTKKSNECIRIANIRKDVENEFIRFAYKIGRSDKQREERKSKRK